MKIMTKSSDLKSRSQNDYYLSLAHQEISKLSVEDKKNQNEYVEILDLSHNEISDVSFLTGFQRLKTVVLDHNLIGSNTVFPYLPMLSMLWLNYNLIVDLSTFIPALARSCPALNTLSLVGNDAAPSYFNGKTLEENLSYRYRVIYLFPQLCRLDDQDVTPSERQAARTQNDKILCVSAFKILQKYLARITIKL
ncbi:leucine-rich melanocyte differentiation-associated protein-like [Limulus polyphemus]|uniref:Leucine-rich melanocyte differentiation-associated protein-like n=1 Tax=Limulus polyphemus TaxID=6850 RepID=A0ABM1TP56_LIMPO|nr:leucine-rich melanocyte differentiation-associated protein-like [Limulus polyphemus]